MCEEHGMRWTCLVEAPIQFLKTPVHVPFSIFLSLLFETSLYLTFHGIEEKTDSVLNDSSGKYNIVQLREEFLTTKPLRKAEPSSTEAHQERNLSLWFLNATLTARVEGRPH